MVVSSRSLRPGCWRTWRKSFSANVLMASHHSGCTAQLRVGAEPLSLASSRLARAPQHRIPGASRPLLVHAAPDTESATHTTHPPTTFPPAADATAHPPPTAPAPA